MMESVNYQLWLQHIVRNPMPYEAKFIVHNATDILLTTDNILESEDFVENNQPNFVDELLIFLVPRHFNQIRLRMLKIKSLSAGEWMPTYPIVFFLQNGKTLKIEMLVDSGADITFIPLKVGERLGFVKSHGESTLNALGVGSEIPYLVRQNKIKIGETQLDIHLLWGQDESITDVLLGRLDIFDKFDVTFSERQKKIFFIPNSSL